MRLFLKAADGCAAGNRSVSLSPSHKIINSGYSGGAGLPVSLQRANHFTFGTEMLPMSIREKLLKIAV